MKAVLALLFLVALCVADNNIYMGGEFLLTTQNDDGSLEHISSLASYDPDNDVYYDTFEGGVFRDSGFLTLMVEVPMGTYGTGVFTFVDDDHDYSNSVVRYDNDEDDFDTVKDGIYLRNGDSVRYIAGTDDFTVFAGTFDSIEYISEKAGEEVFVPNIAMIDQDDQWGLLDDPDSVFPATPYISGVTAFDKSVFIYARDSEGSVALYSWDSDNAYQVLNTNVDLIGNGIYADSHGNIAGISLNAGATGEGEYDLVFFEASNTYTASTTFLYNTDSQCSANPAISGDPILISYMDGFLIATPDVASNCNSYMWSYYNSSELALTPNYNGIPSLSEIDHLIQGEDGDLWVATTASSTILYLPHNGEQWIQVDLSAFGEFTVLAMEWDNGPDKLLVYGSTSLYGNQLVEVKTDSFPPMVKQKSPGKLYNTGTVSALAVMADPDDDDFELYIGGTFDSIGDKHDYSNFVRWKAGSYDSPLPNLPPINALAASAPVIFYATTECAGNGQQLPIGYYNKDTEDYDVWATIPTIVGGTGCVTALVATDEYVFVGGSFSAQLDNTLVGHAVVYYNRLTNNWHEIGIPNNVSSSLASYEIASLDVATVDGSVYLAMGGHFDFVVDATEYHSFAMYDLSTGTWLSNQALEFATDTIINSVVIDDIESVYLGGQLLLNNQGSDVGVFVYNVNTNIYRAIGYLPTAAEAILLNTVEEDDVDVTYVYAGGNFNNVTQHTGLGYAPSTAGVDDLWTQAAPDSQFDQFYMGDVLALIYTTGGVGANDTNGYDPGYTPVYVGPSSSGGMSAWGTVFLVLFLVVCVVAVVAIIGGGGFVYWKKRQNYQAV